MALKIGFTEEKFLNSSPRIISFLFDCESNFFQNIIYTTFNNMYSNKKEQKDVVIAEDLSFFA